METNKKHPSTHVKTTGESPGRKASCRGSSEPHNLLPEVLEPI